MKVLVMSNPFLKNNNQNTAQQQPSAVPNIVGARTLPPSGYSAPTNVFNPQQRAFYPGSAGGRVVPPPPSMDTVAQHMSNMSLNSEPPQSSISAPPSGSVSAGAYRPMNGRYQIPTTAYNLTSVDPSQTQNQPMYGGNTAAMGSGMSPAYMGPQTNYDLSAPAPSPISPEMQPDEEYVKLSYDIAPNSSSLQGLAGIPFGGVFRPMAPDGVRSLPVSDLGQNPVQRCFRCRAYINPFVSFTDGGRRWRCNFCGHLNDGRRDGGRRGLVPDEYYSHLDMSGKRVDLYERPELCKGQVEFEAGREYCVRPPMFPTYLFLLGRGREEMAR